MPSQLTSVRFDDDTLDDARIVADVQGRSLADIIRVAVRSYVDAQLAEDEMRVAVEKMNEDRITRLNSAAIRAGQPR